MTSFTRGWWFFLGLLGLLVSSRPPAAQISVEGGIITFPTIDAHPGQVIPFCPAPLHLSDLALAGGVTRNGSGSSTYTGGGANVQWDCAHVDIPGLSFQQAICDCGS
jgi:hypothetical protein